MRSPLPRQLWVVLVIAFVTASIGWMATADDQPIRQLASLPLNI